MVPLRDRPWPGLALFLGFRWFIIHVLLVFQLFLYFVIHLLVPDMMVKMVKEVLQESEEFSAKAMARSQGACDVRGRQADGGMDAVLLQNPDVAPEVAVDEDEILHWDVEHVYVPD